MSWNGSDSGKGTDQGQERNGNFLSSTSTSTSTFPFHFNYKALCAGQIVILVGGLSVWMIAGRSKTAPAAAEKSQKPSKIKEVTPAAAAQVLSPDSEKVEKQNDVPPGFQRASNGTLHPAGLPYRPEWKKTHAVISNNFYGVASFKEVPYRNATEQMLIDIFTCTPGEMPPMQLDIPRAEQKKLIEILLDKNEIGKDDSETLAVSKEILAAAKKELMAYIREGGKPQDFFNHYYHELEVAHEKRMMAVEEIHRIAEEENDPEIAKQLQKKVNEGLRKEGILPVKAHLEVDNQNEDDK